MTHVSEQFCGPHIRRTGERIPATRTVNGEAMCQRCFRGRPIEGIEDRIALPFFIAEALNGKNTQAQAHGNDSGGGEGA